MEELEIISSEKVEKIEARCSGWCHDSPKKDLKIELRCSGWCHDSPILEVKYSSQHPYQKYFC